MEVSPFFTYPCSSNTSIRSDLAFGDIHMTSQKENDVRMISPIVIEHMHCFD